MSTFRTIPSGILNHIKTMLTYRDRVAFLALCKDTSRFPIETFTPFRFRILDLPIHTEKTYQLYFNPFDYHATRVSSPIPHSFLGNNFVNIIIYDSPTSYYNIRIYKEYDGGKTIADYLKEYKPHSYYINKITKYIYP